MLRTILRFFVFFYLIGSAIPGYSQNLSIPTIKEYFRQVASISNKEGGELWGLPLWGPLMIVNENTREIFTNTQDSIHSLTPIHDSLFTGRLPDNQIIANTTTRWNGIQWTMLMSGSLSSRDLSRNRLIFHELFHSLQIQLNLPMRRASCDHLDSLMGRILFKLELAALRSALSKKLSNRRKDLENALYFRKFRNELFRGSGNTENDLEYTEGLAEYTGVLVSGILDENNQYLLQRLDSVDRYYESFIQTAGYITGPVYGVLLYHMDKNWQKKIRVGEDSFQSLLQNAYSLNPKTLSEHQYKRIKRKYPYQRIEEHEIFRQRKMAKQVEDLLKKFHSPPILVIPLSDQTSAAFSPEKTILSQTEVYFPALEIIDSFGKLSVSGGAVINYETGRVFVSILPGTDLRLRHMRTDSWELQLSENWVLVEEKEKGIFTVSKRIEALKPE